jgi:superfamily II DNA/RNA helicase
MHQTALQNLNIKSLNDMQMAAIEAAKKSHDVVLLSPTGSGKTIAFLFPVLQQLKQDVKGVQALIVVPSRELALQIESVFKQMQTGFKINACYGGHSTKTERNNLEQAPAILVGTPGRIAFHIRNKYLDTSTIHFLVLDEFDKALEFGFQNDLSFIIFQLPKIKRRMLTSATQMDEIPEFTGIHHPIELNYMSETPAKPKGLLVKVVKSNSKEKIDTLLSLICKLGNSSTLVFCNHRDAVDRISLLLKEQGLIHGTFHGKMEQEDRERALIKFRNGTYQLLVTTDLAARGLDIPEIENIIHYQLPRTEEIFIHRNGRTARMNALGTAFLMIGDDEHIPPFIEGKPEVEKVTDKYKVPANSMWCTVYLSAGKKDKINKMDIVGMFLQKGKLEKDDLGLIEVLDFSAYAAVNRKKVEGLLRNIANEKIKNKKVKIEVSE